MRLLRLRKSHVPSRRSQQQTILYETRTNEPKSGYMRGFAVSPRFCGPIDHAPPGGHSSHASTLQCSPQRARRPLMPRLCQGPQGPSPHITMLLAGRRSLVAGCPRSPLTPRQDLVWLGDVLKHRKSATLPVELQGPEGARHATLRFNSIGICD